MSKTHCPKCGKEITKPMFTDNICYGCGCILSSENKLISQQTEKMCDPKKSDILDNELKSDQIFINNKIKTWTFWNITSIISFICACYTFYKGYDKLTNYYNSDYHPYKNINAYVGGDAYNYIINGNYATAYFVLTNLFVLLGVGFVIVHYVSQNRKSSF